MPRTALALAPYLEQRATWPVSGRHILAQYDAESVVVYQAYNPAIAAWAVEHQRLGGPWSFGRMSWIKPNFLWMMFRCGWATKQDQERVLALRISRSGFEHVLSSALESSYQPEVHGADRVAWQQQTTDVRMQWDPDHAPSGAKEERRAVQLGLRGRVLRRFATEWMRSVEDITEFVHEQRAHRDRLAELVTPRETVYSPADPAVRARLRVSPA